MGLIILGLIALLWSISLVEAFQWIKNQYHLSEYQRSILHVYVNESSWFKFQCFCSLLIVLMVLGVFYYKVWINDILTSFCYALELIFKEIKALSIMNKGCITLVLLLLGVLLMLLSRKIYFQLDELNSWLYFVNRGALVTMAYFPSSNNHIGYNLTSVFWNQFLNPVLAMRMTSWLSALGSVLLFYVILLRRYSSLLALVGIVILMTSFPFVWYAIQGRAYGLEVFLLLLLCYFSVVKSDPRLDWIFLFVAAFTIYTVSVALIPVGLLTMVYIYVMCYDVHFLKRMLLVLTGIFVLEVLFYSPVWIFSDRSLLYSNSLALTSTYAKAPWVLISDYYPGVWRFVTGTEGDVSIALACFLLFMSVWLWRRKKYTSLIPLFFLVIVPSLLFLIHPVYLFERTWLWLCIPFVCFLVEILFQVKQYARFLFYTLTIVLLFSWTYFNYEEGNLILNKSRLMEAELEGLKSKVCNTNARLRIDDDILYTYFRFYERTCHFSVSLGVDHVLAQDWCIVPPMQFSQDHDKHVVYKNSLGVVYKYP